MKGKRPYSKGSCRKVRKNAKKLTADERWHLLKQSRDGYVKRAMIPLRTAKAMVRAGLPLRRSELRGNGPYSRTILKILKSPIEAYSKGKRVNDLYQAVLIRFGDGPDGELGIMIGWRNRMGELVKTPGAWTLDSLKDASDTIAIDYGQGWFVRGMHGAIAEAKSDALYRIRDLKGNQSRFQRGLNKSIPPEMKEKVSYYTLARIVEAIKNLKKRNYNDEMIESVVVKERPGRPRDFIIIVKHRYFVNGSRIYSAGLKTEETIEKFVRVIGTKTKRIGNSDYVFNVYGVRFPEAIKKKPGKLFDNPKSFPNIEKSKFHKGQYVGYSPKAVNVFSITRNRYGSNAWQAIGQIYKTNPPGTAWKILYGKDLAEISKALENL